MIRLDDREIPWRSGMTVADLLESVEKAERYAVVRVNGHYVSRPHFAATRIPDEAEIRLIPMIAGG